MRVDIITTGFNIPLFHSNSSPLSVSVAEGLLHPDNKIGATTQRTKTSAFRADLHRGLAFMAKRGESAANTGRKRVMAQWAGRALHVREYGSEYPGQIRRYWRRRSRKTISLLSFLRSASDYGQRTNIPRMKVGIISDKVDHYDKGSSTGLTLGQILLNPRGVLNQFPGRRVSWNISAETARANAGAGLATKCYRTNAFREFIAKRLYAWAREDLESIDQNIIRAYLRAISSADERVALREAGRAAFIEV